MKSFKNNLIACFMLLILTVVVISTSDAQETKFRDQAWRYGITAGVQFNTASLGWQNLHQDISTGLWDDNFHSPENDIDLVDGTGMGLYGGLFGAYLSDSWWGIQFRICYDERNALINDITQSPELTGTPTPSFDTKMTYISFAPSFRIDQPWIPDLNLHVGFFINANLVGTYIYKPDKDEDFTEPEVDVENRNIATYGLQGGLAYDFKLLDINKKSAMYVAPFFDVSWLVNQRKSEGQPSQNSVTDIWSTLSYRVGFKIALDYRQYAKEEMTDSYIPPMSPRSTVRTKKVAVEMPIDNVILTRNVKGYFPILPYVFFEKSSRQIPSRYTVLSKADARNFKESDLEDIMKGDLTTKETNIDQLMKTYYNVLNIYGDRMRNNPNEKLVLRGSDPEEKDAQASADVVKKYLVDNFGIDPNRITVETDPPFSPSGSAYTEEVSKRLIDNENRRVKFVFNNPEMTKPVEYTIRDESSIDNDMFFSIDRSVNIKSWDITITGEGKTMYFGPYYYKYARINPSELMRFLKTGEYNAKVEITDRNGSKIEENVAFKLTKETEIRNASRYLMLFDYNSNDAIRSYENKIRREIAPAIVTGNKVIVHGHTDNIGTAAGNQKLSQERAEEVKKIIDNHLTKENRKADVRAIGVGQNVVQYSFNNRYPEGRMYNRNIFIEIMK
jgi:outer membrane protein OmpA-like peptidoglycan-associated protein